MPSQQPTALMPTPTMQPQMTTPTMGGAQNQYAPPTMASGGGFPQQQQQPQQQPQGVPMSAPPSSMMSAPASSIPTPLNFHIWKWSTSAFTTDSDECHTSCLPCRRYQRRSYGDDL